MTHLTRISGLTHPVATLLLYNDKKVTRHEKTGLMCTKPKIAFFDEVSEESAAVWRSYRLF